MLKEEKSIQPPVSFSNHLTFGLKGKRRKLNQCLISGSRCISLTRNLYFYTYPTKMMKIDPIIAVSNVEASSNWYQKVFACKRTHGGTEFAVLVSQETEVLLCLHKWGEHDHPSMTSPGSSPGNGLILYFKTENLEEIRRNIERLAYPIEEDIHLNPNSTKKEFSVKDPDGYYLIVTEYHNYGG